MNTQPLQFDVLLPNCREGMFAPSPYAGPEEIVHAAKLAEELGYDTLWAADFLSRTPDYPASDGGPPNWYEPLISLSYVAAVTTRIKLGTGVIMAPFREPVVLAKQVATLDRFSKGRLLLGLGLGAFRSEFENINGLRPKANRGRMLDDSLALLQRLLNEEHPDGVSFESRYNHINDVSLNPRPVQQPLPLYIPGRTPASLERVAKWCHGVMFAAGAAVSRIAALEPVLAEHGRNLKDIDVIAEADLSLADTQEEAEKRYWESHHGQTMTSRRGRDGLLENNWVGTPALVAEKIAGLIEQGVTHFYVLHTATDTVGESLEQMQRFAEGVIGQLRKN